jgi:hypothetical protein
MIAIRMTTACLGVAVGVLSLSGCMQARIEESREAATPMAKGERVVILAKPQIEGAGAEDEFMDCIGNNLNSGSHRVAVHDNNDFVDQMFPWFEPSTAPGKPADMGDLLARPGVADQVTKTGVRYVVWLDGSTRKTDGGGSLACGAAPGGAGCFGFGWWQKESAYEATIWDLKQGKSAGSVGTNVTGTSAIVGAIVPLPFIARVQATACNRMSSQLRSFFSGTDGTAAGTH